ncbi:MAG: endopeptidase [Gaiellaceae bacterium]|nr:endopeptidase [Gaiellaceae bacterium]
MSRGAAARAALAAALAACWAVAAWLLWRSSVVPTLHLPRLDEHAYFSPAQLRATASFGRFTTIDWVLTTLAQLVALGVYARKGVRFAQESAAGRLGTGMLLGMIGFALVWAVQLPFGVAGLWWERRHHLTHVGYFTQIFGNWLGLGGEFVFLCIALAVVMGLARVLPELWWAAAAPFFIGLALLFAFINPYLISTHRLPDPQLRAAVVRLERIEHVRHIPVVVENVHDVTSLPNAEATGLGPSRRVVLWDTIVAEFTPREVKVVIAHELGHLAHDHIWKDIGWYALFAFPGMFLIARATRRRGGMARPGAVPLSLFVLVALNLVALPLQNAITRHMEAEADWSSLQATRDPAGATALFRRFVPTTLGEPNPSTFEYVLLENHPTIMQRIAMAQAWRSRYAASDAQSP